MVIPFSNLQQCHDPMLGYLLPFLFGGLFILQVWKCQNTCLQEQRAEEEERVQATERRAAQASEQARKSQALESQVLNKVSDIQVWLFLLIVYSGYLNINSRNKIFRQHVRQEPRV